MNTGPQTRLPRRNRSFQLCRLLFYVFLLVFAVWHVPSAALKISRFFYSSTPSGEDACELDSFSQPAIAATILNQEAGRLLLLYTEARDAAPRLQSSQSAEFAQTLISPHPHQSPLWAQDLKEPTAAQAAALKPLAEIHQTVRGLSADLDRKLLTIYFHTQAWDGFLNCYLRLLETEPTRADVVSWEWCALSCSQQCGRTEELRDAIEHVIRFHPELKIIHGLKSVLEEWQAQNTSDLGSQGK